MFGLRARLFFLVALAVLPAVGLLVFTYLEQRQDAKEASRDHALQLTRIAAGEADLVTQQGRQLLVGLSRLDEVRNRQPEACGALFGDLLDQFPLYANLGVAGTDDGLVWCSALPQSAPVNVADRLYFQRAIQNRGLGVGEYIIGRISGKASLTLGYPVTRADGAITSVVFASIDLAWLNGLARAGILPDGATVLVTDRNGTILARYPDAGDWVGRDASGSPAIAAVLSAGTGTAEVDDLDGTPRLFSFAPIAQESDVGAYLAVGLSPEAAYASADETLVRNLTMLGAVGLFVLLAAGTGSHFFILGPTRRLLAAVRHVESGDLSARSAVRGTSEIGQLAAAFDDMACALERRKAEADAAQAAIEEQAADLRRINEELEAFTYSASHDLKEPLRTIEAFSGFLIEDYADRLDDQGRDYLQRLGKASVRMRDLIDDLQALSRIGRRAEPPAPLALRPILDGIVEGMQETIEATGARVEIDASLPDVLADRARVEQIFGNLLSNALKFNTSHAPVIVVCAESVDSIYATFSVRDNGIGIDPKYHEQVFGLFQRLHRREEYEGTGAGLAIVKRAVEALGGQIWIESQPGRGAAFWFRLPLALATEQQAA